MADELANVVAALGLEKYSRHIFLCADQTEPQCAPREQTLVSWEFLKRRLKELNLVGPQPLAYRSKVVHPPAIVRRFVQLFSGAVPVASGST